jgi:hypothetical protein
MLSRISEATKRFSSRVGVPYLRVPTMRVSYLRPFPRGDGRGALSNVAVPYLRIPAMQLKVYRPFH